MAPWAMRAIFNDETRAKEVGVFNVNLSIGTSTSPWVADSGATLSVGVKSTVSGYSRIPADLVVSGGVPRIETAFGTKTTKDGVPLIRAPTVTSSPDCWLPSLFRSR